MKKDYEKIPFFKIPRFIRHYNSSIDEITIEKRYSKAIIIRDSLTRQYTHDGTVLLDTNLYFINKAEQLIINGWTFRGSQFLEISDIYIYKNPVSFNEFLRITEDQTRNSVVRRFNNRPICSIDIMPKFYMTSKYNHEYSHLFTWPFIDNIDSISSPKPRKFVPGTVLGN